MGLKFELDAKGNYTGQMQYMVKNIVVVSNPDGSSAHSYFQTGWQSTTIDDWNAKNSSKAPAPDCNEDECK